MAPHSHAFISYSHQADMRTAAALQRALQRVGKPWYAPSRVRVFRDQTTLAAAPGLWSEIERHLEASGWFVLMASPAAAASPWVCKEVQWWLEQRSTATLLVVLTAGDLVWDAAAGCIDAQRSPSVPPPLVSAFDEEPLWVDLRWAAAERHLTLRHARFRDAALTLAAGLLGRTKDELDSAEIREHRRFVWAAGAAALAFNLAVLGAGFAWWTAREQRARAEENWRESQSRRLATQALEELDNGRVDEAIQHVALAWRLARSAEARDAMRRVVQAGGGAARVLGHHGGQVSALDFTPDGSRLVTAAADGSLAVWSARGWRREGGVLEPPQRAVMPIDERRVTGLAFDARGTRVLAWNERGSGWLWHLDTGRALRLDTGLKDWRRLYGAALAPRGDRVVLMGDGLLAVWTPASGALESAPGTQSWPRALSGCFVGDERVRIVVVGFPGAARVGATARIVEWDLARNALRQGSLVRRDDSTPVRLAGAELAWAPDCGRIVFWDTGRAVVWEVGPALALRKVFALPDDALHDRTAHGAMQAWLSDAGGHHLMLAALDDRDPRQTAWEWQHWSLFDKRREAETGRLLNTFGALAASPGGEWLAAVGPEGVALWDRRAGKWGTQPARRLDVTCSEYDDICADRLCKAVGTPWSEEDLRRLFGIQTYEVFYDTHRGVIDAAACAPGR